MIISVNDRGFSVKLSSNRDIMYSWISLEKMFVFPPMTTLFGSKMYVVVSNVRYEYVQKV